MNVVIFLIVILTMLFYNFYGFYRGEKNRTTRKVAIAIYALFSFVSIFAVIRMSIIFEDGFSQSDLVTNWSLGLFLGVVLVTLTISVIFLINDIGRLLHWIWIKLARKDKQIEGRRHYVKVMSLGLASIPFMSMIWGMVSGKYNYQVSKVRLKFPDLPEEFDGFTIAQFSDFHSGSYDDFDAVKRGIEMIQNLNADVIAFTGDWINAQPKEIEAYKDLISTLNAPCGKYACLGNHDYGDGEAWRNLEAFKHIPAKMKEHIADMGFHGLHNDSVEIEKGNSSIHIVGVENYGGRIFPKKGDLDKATEGIEDNAFKVLLSHDPSHWDLKIIDHPKHFHLTMSGHTHGAQMGVDNQVIRWSPAQYIYNRWAGLYKESNQFLYVNKGFGFIGYAGRLGIPPEITLFELRKA